MSPRHRLKRALESALALPSEPQRQTLSITQLRLLCRVHATASAARAELRSTEDAGKRTTDSRITFLCRQHLIETGITHLYRERQFVWTATPTGAALVERFRGGRADDALLEDLRLACDLTREKREQTARAVHLEVLRLITREGERTVTSLLPYFEHRKPSLRSRLQYLERKELIIRQEQVNYGGANSPTHFDATARGRQLLRTIMPGC